MDTTLRVSSLFLLTIALAGPLAAQTVVPDSTPTTAATDSLTRGPRDSVSRGGGDTGGAAGVSSTPNPDALDPSLAAACKPGPKGEPVTDVLLVRFRAKTTPKDRAAAAASVKGRLAGEAPTGETYVALNGSIPVRVAADKIILSHGVLEVSDAPCP